MMMRLCLLVVGASALVTPVARPPRAVVCGGATYDYCVQALGCTAEEATKAEGALLPNIAESITRTQAEEMLGWLRSSPLEGGCISFPQLIGRLPPMLLAPLEPQEEWPLTLLMISMLDVLMPVLFTTA